MEASITLQTGSKNVSPEFFVRNAFSLAAFVCVLCEYIENLDEEVKLIWKGPMNWVKGLYLTTRYSVLVSFLVNTGLLLFGRMRLYPNDIADCRRWFSLSETVACVPMFAIDALSMIRIYVLYQRSFRIGAFVASLIFAEAILVTTSTSTAMKTLGFTPDCQATDVPLQVLFFGAWVVMTQMALIWFTFHKLKSIAGELHASTVYLVLYQGMWLCFFVVVLIFLTMLCSAIMGTGNPNIISIWPSALSSSILCRVILSLRRGSRHQHDILGEKTELQAQFTSWFSSPSEGAQDSSRNGARTLRRRIPFTLRAPDSRNNSTAHPPTRSSMDSDPSDGFGSRSRREILEAGVSLSDVGLQEALANISSLRPNSIQ